MPLLHLLTCTSTTMSWPLAEPWCQLLLHARHIFFTNRKVQLNEEDHAHVEYVATWQLVHSWQTQEDTTVINMTQSGDKTEKMYGDLRAAEWLQFNCNSALFVCAHYHEHFITRTNTPNKCVCVYPRSHQHVYTYACTSTHTVAQSLLKTNIYMHV